MQAKATSSLVLLTLAAGAFVAYGAGVAAQPARAPATASAAPPAAPSAKEQRNLDALTAAMAAIRKGTPANSPPTLQDWQKLVDSKPKGVDLKALCPMGPGNFVMSMCQDQQDRLWVGLEDGGIFCFDPAKPLAEAWHHFSTQDGLGENSVYCLACDHHGRIWAGHTDAGLSVCYDGNHWAKFGILDGPLAGRVFHIAVCPTDGDVWSCTSAGLTRYSPSKDTWSYYTRAEGLPSDQANSLAFAADGTAYLATACDGMAIAGPADNHSKWRQVKGLDGLSTTPTGIGLPTNLINDVLVARDGTVYAATTTGLAWSVDKGVRWQYIRGGDWAEKVKQSVAGAPKGWTPAAGAILGEDYCTALAEDPKGNIHVGHRSVAGDVLSPRAVRVLSTGVKDYCTSILLTGSSDTVTGTYGNGIRIEKNSYGNSAGAAPEAALGKPADCPNPAAASSGREIQQLYKRVIDANAAQAETIVSRKGLYLGADWSTLGDWVNSYGKEQAVLWATSGSFDAPIPFDPRITIYASIGPHHTAGDVIRRWVDTVKADNVKALYNPIHGYRTISDLDDHGEVYSRSHEGPDIHMTFKVPQGAFRVSLYFVNKDGHSSANSQRDYLVELRRVKAPVAGEPPATDSSALAKCRVKDFWSGVYQRFIISGPGTYDVMVRREYSLNATCAGIFLDKIPLDWGGTLEQAGKDSLDPEKVTPRLTATIHFIDFLDSAFLTPEACYLQERGRVLGCRTAMDCPAMTGGFALATGTQCDIWWPERREIFDWAMARRWEKDNPKNQP